MVRKIRDANIHDVFVVQRAVLPLIYFTFSVLLILANFGHLSTTSNK